MSKWYEVEVVKIETYLVEVEDQDPENVVIEHVGLGNFDETRCFQFEPQELEARKKLTTKDKVLAL